MQEWKRLDVTHKSFEGRSVCSHLIHTTPCTKNPCLSSILWGNSICKHHVLYVWCAHNECLFPYITCQLWSHKPLQTFWRTNRYMHLRPSMPGDESNRWYWKATRCTFHFTKQMLHNRCFQGLEILGRTKRPDVRLESIWNICKKLWTHVVWCANHLRVTSLIRHLWFLHSKS
jgi:hypothetical protein